MPRAVFLASVCLFVLATTACQPRSPGSCTTSTHDEFIKNELHLYEVPEGHEAELAYLLEHVHYPISTVSSSGVNMQFVHVVPRFTETGYVSITAPGKIHAGVREILAKLKNVEPRPAQRTVEVNYWFVLGWPADATSVGPRLTGAKPALDALGILEPMRFELLEKTQLRSLEGESGEASGPHAKVKHTAIVDENKVGLSLRITVKNKGQNVAELKTRLNLKLGQFGVLGEAGFTPEISEQGDAGKPTLFYLVQARIAE